MPIQRFVFFCLFSLSILSPTFAQSDADLAQLEPSDIYFQGYMHARKANQLIEAGKFLEAFDKLNQAKHLFDNIIVNHPRFKPDLVTNRRKITLETLTEIHDQALAQQEKVQEEEAEIFVEGPRAQKVELIVPRTIKGEMPDTREVERLRTDISTLRQRLANSINDRDATAARLRRTLADLEREKAREASAAVQGQLQRYEKEIAELRNENRALSVSLRQTRTKYRDSLKQLEITQEALQDSKAKVRELEAVVREQTDVNARVIKGQQDQIDSLRRTIKEKDRLYGESLAQIKDLKIQLEQSDAMMTELQRQRSAIAEERDHMANLLKISSGDRIQTLINQNVSLSKELNEATRRLQVIENDQNADRDDLLEAKNRLVVAKQQIIKLQKENQSHRQNVTALRSRLATVESDLVAAAQSPTNHPLAVQENELLRDIIRKQKAHMEMQERTGQLLLAQAERMATSDETVAQAVTQFKGSFTPALTEEEEELVAGADADFTVTSRFRPGEAERKAAGRRLESFKKSLNQVAQRLFRRKDYQAARGNFEMIVEEDPGAWDAMINLGIVHLNLDSPLDAIEHFNQAVLVAGDRQIPFAHFMLGVAHKKSGDLEKSRIELETSLKLESSNERAHVLLGNIAGAKGELDSAELHFKKALEIKPTMWEPHRNLAQIAHLRGNDQSAREHYRTGLKNGAPIDLTFETTISPETSQVISSSP